MKPQQRVILYRHGLSNEKAKREAKAKYYRDKSGKEYFACPGGCGKQVSLNRYNGVSRHYSDQKNKTHCKFQGALPGGNN